MHVLVWVCAYHSTGVAVRRQCVEVSYPIYCVGPRVGTQDVRLGDKQLHLVSHLISPCTFLFSIHALLSLKCLHLLSQLSVR